MFLFFVQVCALLACGCPPHEAVVSERGPRLRFGELCIESRRCVVVSLLCVLKGEVRSRLMIGMARCVRRMRGIDSAQFATERMVAAEVSLSGSEFCSRLRLEAGPDFLCCLFGVGGRECNEGVVEMVFH